jgi:hypothetical protein
MPTSNNHETSRNLNKLDFLKKFLNEFCVKPHHLLKYLKLNNPKLDMSNSMKGKMKGQSLFFKEFHCNFPAILNISKFILVLISAPHERFISRNSRSIKNFCARGLSKYCLRR